MRGARELGIVLLGLALPGTGCGRPEVTPVAPPGLEYTTIVPENVKDEAPAEAIGEARASQAMMPDGKTSGSPIALAEPTEPGKSKKLESGLEYETIKPGDGPVAEAGKRVYVHYTGTLTDGTKFDSSRDSGRPYQFVLGAGGVIKGWDLGIAGMKQGEQRKLTIPPDLAYGAEGRDSIPPNATLIFDLELVKVE